MASFDEHIVQAKNNLKFLSNINSKNQGFWDWQVTVAYYTGVHIVNAHLAAIANLHHRSHEAVKHALNPFNSLSLAVVPQEIYLAYTKLENLSRRSRYLCHDDPTNPAPGGHLTFDKHFAKAIRHLDKVIDFFKSRHNFNCDQCKISCPELSKGENLKCFEV